MITAMKVQITAKKMQLSPSFSDYAEERLSAKLDKFFGSEASAKIVLNSVKNKIILELTVEMGGMIFRAEQSADDKNDALDACIDKIIRQIRKNKTRIQKRIRSNDFAKAAAELPESEEEKEFDVRVKEFDIKPMSTDEAILQMNLLDHSFFVFENEATGKINVVYKREGNSYGLIEPVK